MSVRDFLQKDACDKNNLKIGKITKVKTILDGNNTKVVSHIYVFKRLLSGDEFLIEFEIKDVLSTGPTSILLNITKAEFNDYIKKKRAYKKYLAKNAKITEATANQKAYALGFWGKL